MSAEAAAVMRRLIQIRKRRGLTTAHVGQRMHTRPEAVYMLEWRATEGGKDIHVSTLVRYMRAIGLRLAYEVTDADERNT